ncbi:MAG: hypothetical protein CL920_26020, partial [Deltaproteobacteria bacterium]|nr:hypothetical protein [Deltaproteobacteria bacterium]
MYTIIWLKICSGGRCTCVQSKRPVRAKGQKIEKSIRRGAGSRAGKQAGGGGIATLCQRRTTNLMALTQALTYSFFHL